MMQYLGNSLRAQARSSMRSYATSAGPSASSRDLAPILLGLGVVSAGAYYYSTLDGSQKVQQVKQAVVAGPPALTNSDFKWVFLETSLKKSEADPSPTLTRRPLKLVKVTPYNHNTSTFTFELPEGTSSGLTVASALVVKAAKEGEGLAQNGKPAVRPYTPITEPSTQGKLDLLVKHYKGGAMTEHIFSLKEGDDLLFKGPIPKFPYKANQFESITLIAGGSGLTPMWQILQQIANDPNDKTKATLIYSNVTEADILLRKELATDALIVDNFSTEAFAAKRPGQINVKFVLDQPPAGWTGAKGYVDQKLLAQSLPGPAFGDKIKIFVCGPPGQVAALAGPKDKMEQGPLKGILADLGYTESQTYKF
ncbi:BZ3500_MvSof-1268-A1-R1_Chr1-1g00887 [Microbotryum saponariae]|uniref:cytochrome-b5 reductase n=1 Tax=Microbotryum saponariae TaxID=289078 RepID=A0A2X0L2E3_9BASI|nr:BZ3500_MvSof-1268-A1-R1_Chr1-1g00887 [Microbotryum saponariae]SCZ92861.1 BZ3501_MvSof-1269-A2-R1_Chr1-1g00484 [Microbotryum saponariae]